MLNIDILTTFLGWCSILNIGLFILATIALILMRESISHLHSTLFWLNPITLPAAYFRYLANYKLAILIFNIVPYVALKIMS
ncbi:MAG: hypothetical protein COB23_04525 [Methylophaga sp.]|nr:MAG: hypothetical protein COB23_04525 [Methylophaga sp.]